MCGEPSKRECQTQMYTNVHQRPSHREVTVNKVNQVSITWVPGNSGYERNERENKFVKQGVDLRRHPERSTGQGIFYLICNCNHIPIYTTIHIKRKICIGDVERKRKHLATSYTNAAS